MWPGFEGFSNWSTDGAARCEGAFTIFCLLSPFVWHIIPDFVCVCSHFIIIIVVVIFIFFFSRIFSFLTYIEALEGSHPGRVLLYISFLSKLPRRSPYSPLIDGMGGNLEGIYQRERGVRTRIETKLLNSFERLCTKSYRTTDRKREKKTLAII